MNIRISNKNRISFKIIFKFLIGIILSALAIWAITRTIDFEVLIKQIEHFNPKIIPFLFLFYPISMVLRSIRWKILVLSKVRVSFFTILYANMIGFFLNYILPARIGEFTRAEIIKRKENISRSFMLGTIIAERLLDSIILLFFLLFSALFSIKVQETIRSNSVSILVFIFTIIFFIILLTNKRIHLIILKTVPRFRLKISKIIDNFYIALTFYENLRRLVKVGLLTLLLWLFAAFGYSLIAKGLALELPYHGYFFLIAMAAFGMIIPSSPGNIGVYHGVVLMSILIFLPGEKEKALSFAIIAHGIDLLMCVSFGLLAYVYTQIKVKNKLHISLFKK